MATDTDYRKYTWRNLGQKELKEIWFAARGTYRTSNQTVSLSALGNYFGTGDFKDSILKHEGPEYLVALRYHGNGTTSENPLPLTYKIDTNDERQNSNVAADITADNVVEISMATGLKVDAYRINGLSFLKNCWRNQEIADSITQPLVDNAETVHEATVDLNLPSNMTYVKLPRYGFTNEAIEKVGVDGLFDSTKEKRTKEDAIGLVKSSSTDGKKIYEPGFKWGASLSIKGQSYDTSLLKEWGFAERIPIVLADTYSAECDFQLPEIKTLGDGTIRVKCKNADKIFRYDADDLLTCNIQKIANVTDYKINTLSTFPPKWQTDTKGYPLYTWYEKKDKQDISHTVTDMLIQPSLTVELSPKWEIHQTSLKANTIYQHPDQTGIEGALYWPLVQDAYLSAPFVHHKDFVLKPDIANLTFNTTKQENVPLPQGGNIMVGVDVPMQMTFREDGLISGTFALPDDTRYRYGETVLVQSETLSQYNYNSIGYHLKRQLDNPSYSPFFSADVLKGCGSDSMSGFLTVSCLPLQVNFQNLILPWTDTLMTSLLFNAQLLPEGPKISEYTEISTYEGKVANIEKKEVKNFHNCPIFIPWLIGSRGAEHLYFWNWNVKISNFLIEGIQTFDLIETLTPATNESFFDKTIQANRSFFTGLGGKEGIEEIKLNQQLWSMSHPTGTPEGSYIKMTDPNWGSHIILEQNTKMCPHHVVFILWSKSPDAYEYLKK